MEMTRFSGMNGFPAIMWSFNDSVNRFEADENQMRPWTPAVDIFETDNELIFRADAPELDLAHTEVQVENGTLTLKGERRIEKDDSVKGYHRLERSYGAFARSFTLPETVDAEDVRAEYAHGVLTVTLSKKAVAKARSIKVTVNEEVPSTRHASAM